MSAYAREGSPYGFDSSRMSPTAASPRGKTFVEGYRSDIMNGFEKEHRLYNPVRSHDSGVFDLQLLTMILIDES